MSTVGALWSSAVVLASSALLLASPAAAATATTHFNITSVAARGGKSVFECWKLATPVTITTTSGIAGGASWSLGEVGNVTYSTLPKHFAGTPHPAPAPQWVAFMSGNVFVTIPGCSDVVTITGGHHGLLFAADTTAVSSTGHSSATKDSESVFIQLPTLDGKSPAHSVLHDGPCALDEQNL